VIDRATVLAQMTRDHAGWPERIIRRLSAGRYGVPVDDLAQSTWESIVTKVRELPDDRGHQRGLIRLYAEWAFQRWLRYGLQPVPGVRVDTISELAERRRDGESASDPDDVVIGLAWHQTVEQVVLTREQLRVVRAAVAQMTPLERLGLRHAMAEGAGSPQWAGAARRKLVDALEAAGYPFRYGTLAPYPSGKERMAKAAYNAQPHVREQRRARYLAGRARAPGRGCLR